MVYACDQCKFLFYRASEMTACPACDTGKIRVATDTEIQKLQLLLQQQRTATINKEEPSR